MKSLRHLIKQIGNSFLILSIKVYLGECNGKSFRQINKNPKTTVLYSVFGLHYSYMALASCKSLRTTGYNDEIVLYLYLSKDFFVPEHFIACCEKLNIVLKALPFPSNCLFKKNSAKLNSINHFIDHNNSDTDYLLYFDADCIFNRNPVDFIDCLEYSSVCLTSNNNPAVRYKKLTGQVSHFGSYIKYDTSTPEFVPLPNGGFIGIGLNNPKITKCFKEICQEYNVNGYVDDQAYIRKHLFSNRIIPLYLDTRAGMPAENFNSTSSIFTHYGGTNRYKMSIYILCERIFS